MTLINTIRKCLKIVLLLFVATIHTQAGIDNLTALKDTLNALSTRSEDEIFQVHCQSVISVFEDKTSYTTADSVFLEEIYNSLLNVDAEFSPREFSSYLGRSRSLIIAWTSPTDNKVSFTRLKLPKDWDPSLEYPLYIDLHGMWDVASNSISYLNYPFTTGPSSSFAFEDGYLISPWGRGNIWYRGIGETDIWECIDVIEDHFFIDPYRKYIFGHSMGGSGAWYIAHKTAEIWAAVGSHAGALWYNQSSEVNETVAAQLKDVPAYFVAGNSDGNLSINQQAYQLLLDAGNTNAEFVIFEGGHDYIQENVENMYVWMKEFVNEDYTKLERTMETNFMATTRLWNYPNPANNSTLINYNLAHTGSVELGIYSQGGRQVQALFEGEKEAGQHVIEWLPGELPSGLYYCRLKSKDRMVTIKILIVD